MDTTEPSSADPLLDDLTEEQRRAAAHVDGPLLIIAGAGSGKTRVITRRVAHLIQQGIAPWSVLAITFTNKAAGEMKQRIGALSDRALRDFGRLDQPWPIICTFHSLCLRILRHYGATIGLPGNFTIYDSGDQTRVVKEALKSLDISSTNFSPSTIHSTISNAKNQLVSAEQFAAQANEFYTRTVARVYLKYQQLLNQNNALDFDDLLMRATNAFREHPKLLNELQDRFQYILIDEYQDTNHAQYILAHALANKHRNICVVGDPDQSIYAWRGADIRNILEFEKDYPDATVVKLEQNYRSTKTILKIASALIAHNAQRKDKSLWTENEEGAKARVTLCQDEHDEAKVVLEWLRELKDRTDTQWSQMAVFYRVNALSRVMEKALFDAGVPYQIARGVEFYNRREIKDVLAYLRVIANPNDQVSLERIVNVPTRGLGDTSIKSMNAWAIAHSVGLWEALSRVAEIPNLSARASNAAKQFVTMIEALRDLAAKKETSIFSDSSKGTVQTIMEAVVTRSGYEAHLRKDDKAKGEETGDSPMANVNELVSAAVEYDAGNDQSTLDDYLSSVSLVSDADHLAGNGGAVTLMTLHAAKGLEFPAVAIIGLEEGCLPHSRARGNPTELEEERRLCFVGITRAEQSLLFTKAAYRTLRGLRERTITSPFLNEMPRDALEILDRTGVDFPGASTNSTRDRAYLPEPRGMAAQFRKGQRVRHPSFGIGTLADVVDMGQHTRAVVEFQRVGRKTLILQYARLEAID